MTRGTVVMHVMAGAETADVIDIIVLPFPPPVKF